MSFQVLHQVLMLKYSWNKHVFGIPAAEKESQINTQISQPAMRS